MINHERHERHENMGDQNFVAFFRVVRVFRGSKKRISRFPPKETDMSITVTIEEAQAKLKELVHQLAPGDEIIITEQHKTVARLRGESEQVVKRPPPGLGKGSIVHMSADFDEPLDEMKEYME